MTDSYKVKPQRQIRDRSALPARPKELPRPAAPLEIPQQVGGQLIDRREYVVDSKVQQGLQAMQTWKGFGEKNIEILGEERRKKAAQEAEELIKQETYALQQSLQNLDEVEKLEKKQAFEEAKYAKLKNPYINLFYYQTKSDNASKIISTKLAKWGEDNADRLARIEDKADVAAQIAAQADSLQLPYANLPKNFIEARIDPIVAATTAEVKNLVNEKELDVAQEKIDNTISEAFIGKLILATEFATVDPESDTGSKYAEGAMTIAYNAGWQQWQTLNGKDRRGYHQWLFDNFGQLYMDNNENNYNDLSEGLGIDTVINGLNAIKIDSGAKLLDAKFTDEDGNKMTMRDRIREVLVEQQKIKQQKQNQANKEVDFAQKNWKQDTLNEANKWIAEALNDDGDLDGAEADAMREQLRQKAALYAKKGLLPYTLTMAYKEIDKMFPVQKDKLSEGAKGELLKELNFLLEDQSLKELPESYLNRVRGTELYYSSIKAFEDAKKARGKKEANSSLDSIVTLSKKNLKIAMGQDEQIVGAVDSKLDKAEKSKFINQAYDLAVVSYEDDARRLARIVYQDLSIKHKDDPKYDEARLIAETESIVSTQLLSRPEYNDIDYYFDIGGLKNQEGTYSKFGQAGFGARVAPPSQMKVEGDGVNKPWDITFENEDSNDGGFSWKVRNRVFFATGGDGVKYAQDNFLFNNDQFKEINSLVASGDPTKLTPATRTAIANRAAALNISPQKLLELQITRFNNNNVKKLDEVFPDWRTNVNMMEGLREPTASTGDTDDADKLYVYNDKDLSINGDRGVVWESRKGNDVQTSTRIKSPVGGKIIFVGKRGGYGNQVVIEADRDYPSYNIKKGDQIVTSHLASSDLELGQNVSRGMAIGISGDESDLDSTEGLSTTGQGIKPGQVHTMLYSSGGYENKNNQYSQWKQKVFFDRAYTGLYSAN
jgi:murein DD-endopeptidase MepM/ murein hydrolase activator NlpD